MAKDTNDITREYLDQILIEQRIIGSVLPEIHTEIFGMPFDSPVMTPAFSHMHKPGPDGDSPMIAYAKAAKELNILNWVGMESNETMKEILETGANTVRIIKPFADHGIILDQIQFAEAHGAVAVGIDVDHVFGYDGKYDIVDGMEMGPVTVSDLAHYADATELPFVIKGILSVEDAKKACDAGADGIVVSHHHGRIPSGIAPLMVLPEICELMEGKNMTIFVDCHIDDGVDAFKALALGADAVSVGRGMMDGLTKEGKIGVVKKIQKMNEELITIMGYTGFSRISEIEDSVLWNL